MRVCLRHRSQTIRLLPQQLTNHFPTQCVTISKRYEFKKRESNLELGIRGGERTAKIAIANDQLPSSHPRPAGPWGVTFRFFLLCRGRVRPELFSPSLVLISSNGSLILHQLRPDVHAITYKCVATGRPARDEL